MRRSIRLLPLVLGALTLTGLAEATVHRVDWAGGGDYLTIQEGINAASLGDTVLVAPGSYTGEGNRGLSFGGTNLRLMSEAGSGSTIIDCQQADRALSFRNGEAFPSLVEGFTIQNGRVLADTLDWLSGFGGAVACYESNPGFRDVVFLNNSVNEVPPFHRDGGAVYCFGGIVRFTDCHFEGNVGHKGGAITVEYSTNLFIRDCTFVGNEAANWGGALYVNHGRVVLEDSIFTGNQAEFGGAVKCRHSDAAHTIAGCLFEGNSASHWGGAVGSYYAESTFTDCLFVGNTSAYYGAAVGLSRGAGGFEYCTFIDNAVTWQPGATVSTSGSSVFTNCTFALNTTLGGAAITADDEDAPVVLKTIIAYTTDGGAILCEDSSTPTTTQSCVFGNALGDSLCGSHHDNLFEPPLFCDGPGFDLTLHENSPCLPDNNAWGALVGAHGAGGCGAASVGGLVEEVSWSVIKGLFR